MKPARWNLQPVSRCSNVWQKPVLSRYAGVSDSAGTVRLSAQMQLSGPGCIGDVSSGSVVRRRNGRDVETGPQRRYTRSREAGAPAAGHSLHNSFRSPLLTVRRTFRDFFELPMFRPGHPAAVRLLVMLVLFALAGCGARTYEDRLAASVAYFKYRQRVDRLLEPRVWTAEGIRFRPPRGFVELPPPPPASDDDASPPPDSRQPAFFTPKLPGLVGAWRAELRVEIPESSVEELPAWLLICTNHDDYRQRFDNPQIIPAAFMDNLTNAVADATGTAHNTAVSPWGFTEVRVPSGVAYVPRKDYDWILLSDPEMTYEVNGQAARYDVRLYRYYVGKNIQFALVAIVPSDEILARSARPYDAIDMAIEQLSVQDEIPRTRAGGPATAPTSAGGF